MMLNKDDYRRWNTFLGYCRKNGIEIETNLPRISGGLVTASVKQKKRRAVATVQKDGKWMDELMNNIG